MHSAVQTGRRKKHELRTFSRDFITALNRREHARNHIVWPNVKYAADPVGFTRDILGQPTWSKQTEMLEALRDNDFVAVRAGQKVSKSFAAMCAAWWWYCSVPNGKVRMTSATLRQVEGVLYTQLLELKQGAGLCYDCRMEDPLQPRPCKHSALIDGKVHKSSRGGIKSEIDFRSIVGFTSSKTEGLAGYSGKNQLWILDESSGIDDAVYEACLGNLMAGGKLLSISNPTKTYGWFYDLFHSKSRRFYTIHISGFDSPNVIAGEEVIPGLATRKSLEMLAEDYGEQSAIYKVRALGEFADLDEGRIFDEERIALAQRRNTDAATHCVLSIGIDPSGPNGKGDDSAWVAIRGHKMLRCEGVLGLTDEDHLQRLLTWVAELKLPGEVPYVSIDREGPEGAKVWATINAWANLKENRGKLFLRGIRASDGAIRKPDSFQYMRDELCWAVHEWIEEGGGLLFDELLEADLKILEWIDGVKGKTLLISKKDIRKRIGRSPDRYDALALAVWHGRHPAEEPVRPAGAPSASANARRGAPCIDPFASRNQWRR